MTMFMTISFCSALGCLVLIASLYPIFEPYIAWNNKAHSALKQYYREDLKLRLIAEWWAAKLSNQRWYDDTDDAMKTLCLAISDELVRHRFLTNDYPRQLRGGDKKHSKILRRAIQLTKFKVLSKVESVMNILPNKVSILDGQVIWRGKPQPYKSRFNDFYSES